MKSSRRALTLLLVAMVAVAVLAPITAAQATGPVNHTELVPDIPRLDTPRITSGSIGEIVQWGDRIVLAGTFPGLADADGTAHAQPFVAAYDINTGLVDTTFAPAFDSFVDTAAVSADGNHLFVGGAFNNVNGEPRRKLVKLDTTGAVDPTFIANADARVSSIAVASDGSAIYAGGFLSAVNGTPRGLFAKLNATTGAVDPVLNLPITEGIGSGSTLRVQSLLLTPDNATLVVVHTGRRVNGVLREGVALVNTGTGALLPWQTDLYTENLPRVGGVLRITEGDISPSGDYFVVVSGSGGDRPPINDTAIAWPVAGGAGVEPIWVSRHFDSLYSVAITEHAIYVGGHFRWQEAPGSTDPWPGDTYTNYGWDAGVGAAALGDEVVRRDQIGAIDPATGKSMNWNPGSNAFVGVQTLTAVERGLLVYHDNTILGGFDVGYHGFFDWDSVVNPDGPQTNITDPFSGFTISDSTVDVLGTAYAENGINFVRVWVCQGPCYGQGPNGPFLQNDRVTFSDQVNSFDLAPDTPGQDSTWGLTDLDLPSGTFEARARTFEVGGGSDATVASVLFDVDNDGDDPPITTIVYPEWQDIPESNTFVISGTAADDVGVASVRLTLYERDPDDPNFGVLSPLRYLQDDGTLDDPFNAFILEVDPAGGQVVNWEFEVTLPIGAYTVTANATDTVGQQDNALNLSFFSLTEESDNVPPSVAIASPFFFTEFPMDTSIDISGVASDDVAVAAVELVVFNNQTGSGIQANGTFGPNINWFPATVSGAGADVTWSVTTPPLPAGQYVIQARATDDVGTRTDPLLRPLVIVTAGVPGDPVPDTTLDQEGRDQNVDSLGVSISGTATDDSGVDRVVVTIRETRSRNIVQGRRYVTGAGQYDVLYTEIDAVLSGPPTNRTWTLDGITLPEDGDYTITAKAIDNVGQYDTDQTGATATWLIWPGDTDPYTLIQSPAPDASVPTGSVIIDGRAFDDLVPFCSPGFDCGVRVVELQIRDAAGYSMNELGAFGPAEQWVEVFLTNPTGQFSNWNYATPELSDGLYTVRARAQDLRYQYDEEINDTLIPVPGGEGESLDFITITVGNGIVAAPALTLTIGADASTFTEAGETIGETFTLTNSGNVALDGPFTVNSDQAGEPVACPETTELIVGQSVTCTATNTISAAEVAAGESVTVATGAGSYDGSTVTSNQATLTLDYAGETALTLTVDADSLTFAGAGETIAEQFTLTNTGSVTLNGPFTVDTDQPGDPVTCPATATLAVGASVTCTASNTITTAERNAGQSVTEASGAGSYDGGTVTSNTATLTLTYAPVAGDIAFRAATSSAKKAKFHRLTVPNGVQQGDVMLLFVTAANMEENIVKPAGWERLSRRDDDAMKTVIYWKVAGANEVGRAVKVKLEVGRKANIVLVAYSGVDPTNPVNAFKSKRENGSRRNHKTPFATTTAPGTMILSYWGERSNGSTTSITAPGTLRYFHSMTGGSAITALLVETDPNAPIGTYGGVVGNADWGSPRATMWTIALNPE